MRGISWLAANQLASQEGLCTVEYVSIGRDKCWLVTSKASHSEPICLCFTKYSNSLLALGRVLKNYVLPVGCSGPVLIWAVPATLPQVLSTLVVKLGVYMHLEPQHGRSLQFCHTLSWTLPLCHSQGEWVFWLLQGMFVYAYTHVCVLNTGAPH